MLSTLSCLATKHPKARPPVASSAAVPTAISSLPGYAVTDLGTLPGYNVSAAKSINDRGQVVGVCVRQKNPKIIGDDPVRAAATARRPRSTPGD